VAISLVNPATGNVTVAALSITINVPTGTLDGDVMVAEIMASIGNTTISTPTGWTQVPTISPKINGTTAGIRSAMFYRVANSEPASYQWNFGTSQRGSGVIASFRGVDNTTPGDSVGTNASSTGAAITLPSYTTASNNAWLIGSGALGSSTETITKPAAWTQIAFVSGGQDSGLYYFPQATAGATGTTSWGKSGANEYNVIGWALKPATGGTDVTVNVNALSMTMAAQGVAVSGDANVTLNALSMSMAAQGVAVQGAANVALNSTALTMTPQAVAVRGDANVTVNALAMSMTPQAVTVSITGDVNVAANALPLTMTAQNVSVSTGTNITVNALTLAMVAQAVAVSIDTSVTLNALSMSMAAQGASVSTQSNVNVALNALAMSMTALGVSVNSPVVMGGGLSGLSGLSGLGSTH
jgi:hypothetical protein